MSVNVLCPNGRRENIKVTPNKTILQIIEEVCRRRGFDPSAHDIKHGRNVLDVSTTYRFSGVPNNGKLELVPAAIQRASNTEITIALQSESGERRQLTVKSTITLAKMLELFQQDGEDLCSERKEGDATLHPIVINMRERLTGLKALNFTTLKSIGLISGKAALRLVYQPVATNDLEQINAAIEKEKAKLERYASSQQQSSASNLPAAPQRHASTQPIVLQTTVINESSSSQIPTPDQPSCSHYEPASMDSSSPAFIPTTTSSTTLDQVAASASKVLLPHQSDLTQPDVRPKQSAHSDSSSAAQPVSVSAMGAFSIFPDSVPQLEEKDEAQEERNAKQYIDAISKHANIMSEFKFPEATAGQRLYENPLSAQTLQPVQRCDRDIVVYNMREDQSSHDAQPMELSDDFFEITKEDLRKVLHDLRQQTSEEAILMTESMRERRLEQSSSRYERAVIRFHLPDNFTIQAKFIPRETVNALHDFMKEVLNDPSCKYYLYTTPPKKELKDPTQTLIQARLVPLSIVYVGFHDSTAGDEILKASIKGLTTTKDHAETSAKSSLPASLTASGPVPDPASSQLPGAKRQDSNLRATGSSSGTIPKWYKGALGKK